MSNNKTKVELQPLRDGEVVEKVPERPSPLLKNGSPFHPSSRVIRVETTETTQSIGPGKEVKIHTGLIYNQVGRVAIFNTFSENIFIVDSVQELTPGQEIVLTLKNWGHAAWKLVAGQVVAGMVIAQAEQP